MQTPPECCSLTFTSMVLWKGNGLFLLTHLYVQSSENCVKVNTRSNLFPVQFHIHHLSFRVHDICFMFKFEVHLQVLRSFLVLDILHSLKVSAGMTVVRVTIYGRSFSKQGMGQRFAGVRNPKWKKCIELFQSLSMIVKNYIQDKYFSMVASYELQKYTFKFVSCFKINSDTLVFLLQDIQRLSAHQRVAGALSMITVHATPSLYDDSCEIHKPKTWMGKMEHKCETWHESRNMNAKCWKWTLNMNLNKEQDGRSWLCDVWIDAVMLWEKTNARHKAL